MGMKFLQVAAVILFLLETITGCSGTSKAIDNSKPLKSMSNSTNGETAAVAANVYHPDPLQQQQVINQPAESQTTKNTSENGDVQRSTINIVQPSSVDLQSVPEIFGVPQGEVALTIDDGPSPYTEQIISILNQYHAKATFFFIGNNVLQYPDAIRMAVTSGNEIGDHTVDHPQLTRLTLQMQEDEINSAAKDIGLYDPLPVRLFRPPYELMNRDTMTILAKNHMALALWNRDPRDWAAKTPKQIVRAVLDDSPSGGVFDLHDKLLTMEALPDILKGLTAMHLQIVVLPQSVQ